MFKVRRIAIVVVRVTEEVVVIAFLCVKALIESELPKRTVGWTVSGALSR